MSATAFGQLIGPGFFSNQTVQIALCVGAMTAATSAVVGVFTVIRGHSFGGHALTDVSAAGGAGALLAGMSPLSGFVVGGILG
ncbi:MAG: metal ABC transporter permease, partial [Acidimicrobiales bacterium]